MPREIVPDDRYVKAAKRIHLSWERRQAFVDALIRLRDAHRETKLLPRHRASANAWLFDEVGPFLAAYGVTVADDDPPEAVVKYHLDSMKGNERRGRNRTAIGAYLAWLDDADAEAARPFLKEPEAAKGDSPALIHDSARRSLGTRRAYSSRDWEIASHRIAQEKRERTGRLLFGKLEIDALPEDALELHWLEGLDLCSTLIESLPSLEPFANLKALDCSYTPLRALPKLPEGETLHTVWCGVTRIDDLSPLAACRGLHNFFCGRTLVSDLTPLAACPKLAVLHCEETEVASLSGLRHCRQLRLVDCQDTAVSDLSELEDCEALDTLILNGCHIARRSDKIWQLPHLQYVYFDRGELAQVPPRVLSRSYDENCLQRLRSHILFGSSG